MKTPIIMMSNCGCHSFSGFSQPLSAQVSAFASNDVNAGLELTPLDSFMPV
jgi:hypothetical protein